MMKERLFQRELEQPCHMHYLDRRVPVA